MQKMWKISIIALAFILAIGPMFSSAPVGAQVGSNQAIQPQKQLSPQQQQALRALGRRLQEVEFDDRAVPSWLRGDLGTVNGSPRDAAVEAMRALGPLFRRGADDEFEMSKEPVQDELGQTHVRLQQRYRGLRVVSAKMIVHLQGDRVIGVNGDFIPEIDLDPRPGLIAEVAFGIARRRMPAAEMVEITRPELVVFVTEDKTPRLAWSQQVAYESADGQPNKDLIFADAATGDLLGQRALIWTAKNRKVYSANHGTSLPGNPLWQEGDILFSFYSDALKGAVNGTGKTYDFYKNVFNRDSYNNAGAALISTIHYGNDYNNAYWDSSLKQMVYGDGDGVTFKPLSIGVDVTAHELTHGVTDATADLIYAKESGALNEAISDILAIATENYYPSSIQPLFFDWQIGEDVYTPNVAGDALRYMNNPTLDGYSADYYPDRLYPGTCTPSWGNDYCGVHGNSGIANLAFYLMVVGGQHPQGKTTNVAPAIGMSKARKIWYRALTVYMDEDDNFQQARSKTVQAAADLYGGNCGDAAKAVRSAWNAVGVTPTSLILPCLVLPI
ncbi:MAG TPA: M4 family metallopeptidase [Blastocatellia bacterium]|nr:M4 family metallopeptidase [Blastocatellia bacterium]